MSYFGAETLCEIGNCFNLFSRAPQMEFFLRKKTEVNPRKKIKTEEKAKVVAAI